MLRVSALKKRDGFTLHAEFQAPTPGIVALFGRSGCGKTTLVNVISGLLEADEARIQLDDVVWTDTRAGTVVPVERRRIGYVFQDARLFPHFSVRGNLRYGLKRSRRHRRPVRHYTLPPSAASTLDTSRLTAPTQSSPRPASAIHGGAQPSA